MVPGGDDKFFIVRVPFQRCLPFADCRLQTETADYRLQIADCRLHTANCTFHPADCTFQTADCMLQTADHGSLCINTNVLQIRSVLLFYDENVF